MLSISERQVAAFRAAREDDYVRRAIGYAHEHLATTIGRFDDARLAQIVVACREDARAHGVVSEHGFVLWLFLAGRLGERFHEQSDIAYALRHSDDNDQLLDHLVERLANFEAASAR
jgi:hypothetical protein